MRFLQFIHAASEALLSNKLRSLLTMLGIIIGIASIVIIVSVGNGAQSLVINQVSDLGGSNLIVVLPGASDDSGPPAQAFGITITTLKNDDLAAIRDIQGVRAASGYVRGSATMSWQNESIDSTFTGVEADFETVEDIVLTQGHFFTEDDDKSLRQVVVLGSEVYKNLFGNRNAIGERIRIKRQSFRVIGVVEERGTQFFQNQDNQVFVPLLTAQKKMLGIDHLSFSRALAYEGEDIDRVREDVRQVMREQHDISAGEDDDFSVRSSAQAIDILGSITDVLRYFLAAISALSLLVGGIGIMNIMLVSVLERTREIGLRKAVGARPFDLRVQFLSETIIIAMFGGVIGFIIGVVISYGIALVARALDYHWDYVIGFESIALAIVFPLLTGLIFGYYPARKAARLRPIEALHYE